MTEIRAAVPAWPRQRFVVVFTEPGRWRWFSRFFAPGFRHCYVLIWDAVVWLYVDPTLSHQRVLILDHYEPNHPRDWVFDTTATFVEFKPDIDEKRFRAPWVVGPLTCTEGAKSLLGIRKFWLFTPWQLCKHLRRLNDGRGIEETTEDTGGAGPFAAPDRGALENGTRPRREASAHHQEPARRQVFPAERQ